MGGGRGGNSDCATSHRDLATNKPFPLNSDASIEDITPNDADHENLVEGLEFTPDCTPHQKMTPELTGMMAGN